MTPKQNKCASTKASATRGKGIAKFNAKKVKNKPIQAIKGGQGTFIVEDDIVGV